MTQNPWIQTYTGKIFDLINPTQSMVCIEDIAHSLSMQCRYTGHSKRFYSVAEHCVLMSQQFEDRQLALEALLHDAPEAYYGDIATPLKRAIIKYDAANQADDLFERVRAKIDLCVGHVFNACVAYPPVEIRGADIRMLWTEAPQLLDWPPPQDWEGPPKLPPYQLTLHCWAPNVAEQEYLQRYRELQK